MGFRQSDQSKIGTIAQPETIGFVRWLQDPMGSIIASSVAIIGSFGFVLSGTWFIHLALN
jgi:hypothetical protein